MEGARWIDMKRWIELEKVKNAGKRIPSLKNELFTDGKPAHKEYAVYSTPMKINKLALRPTNMNSSHIQTRLFQSIRI